MNRFDNQGETSCVKIEQAFVDKTERQNLDTNLISIKLVFIVKYYLIIFSTHSFKIYMLFKSIR